MLPHFEIKELEALAVGSVPGVIELSKLSKAALLPPPPAAAAAAAAAAVVSVADASAMLVPPSSSSLRADAKRSKSTAAATADGDGDIVDAAGELDDAGAEGEAEESMGDRARRMGGTSAAGSSGLEAPKADSVAVLLQQGLQVISPRHAHIPKRYRLPFFEPPSSFLCLMIPPLPFSPLQAGDDAMVEQVPLLKFLLLIRAPLSLFVISVSTSKI